MKLSKDKTELRYNDFLTLRGIPPAAFDYRLGNRSASSGSATQETPDQYRVSTDPRSGITNDPNREDDPNTSSASSGRSSPSPSKPRPSSPLSPPSTSASPPPPWRTHPKPPRNLSTDRLHPPHPALQQAHGQPSRPYPGSRPKSPESKTLRPKYGGEGYPLSHQVRATPAHSPIPRTNPRPTPGQQTS